VYYIKFGSFLILFIVLQNSSYSEIKAPVLQNIIQNVSKNITAYSRSEKTQKIAENLAVIKAIIIQGNKNVSVNTILKGVSVKPNSMYSAITKKIIVDQIRSSGYFETVSSQIKKYNNDVTVIITVKEHPIITSVNIIGNKIVDSNLLYDLISSKPNKVFNLSDLRHDIKVINNYYKDNGYSKGKIYRILNPKKSGGALIFYISEGIISSLALTGNIKTRDYVILRELDIVPGDAINDDVIKKNLRRVFNLNYFTNVYPSFTPTDINNEYELQLHLEEKETSGSFSFGGGYSPTAGFNIFSDLYWDNLFGTGQSILLKFSRGIGSINNQSNNKLMYQLRYHNPWMWDKRKSFTFRTWHTSGNSAAFIPTQLSAGGGSFGLRNELRRGIDVAIGIPKTYDFRIFHRLKYELIYLGSDLLDYYELYTYKMTMSYDTRDVFFNPQSGYYIMGSIENSFKMKKYALPFTQFELSLKKFIPTFKKQVLALRADYGYTYSQEMQANKNKFGAQLYYIGGFNAVRGWTEYGADNLNGNKKAIYSVEYRFLFTKVFQFVLFADIGYVSYSTNEFLSFKNYLTGRGFGLRFNVPQIGPIRFDFGWKGLKGLINDDFEIHFNIGHAF